MPVVLEHPGDLDALVQPQAARHAVGHVELGGDRRAAPHRLADRRHHLAGEAGAVLQRAAPPVGAPVELGAEEGAQEVVVAEVDLEAVEPGARRPWPRPGRSRRSPARCPPRRSPGAGSPWGSGRPRGPVPARRWSGRWPPARRGRAGRRRRPPSSWIAVGEAPEAVGTASSRRWTQWRSVRPSGETAQIRHRGHGGAARGRPGGGSPPAGR